MTEFVSEPICPAGGAFDTAALARGEPGLPGAFEWRGTEVAIAGVLERWKQSSREGGSAKGQLYLRRHGFRLRMSDGTIWTVYCLRQIPRSGRAGARWFLQTRDVPDAAPPSDPGRSSPGDT